MTSVHPQQHLRHLLIPIIQILSFSHWQSTCLSKNLKNSHTFKNCASGNSDVMLFVRTGHPACSFSEIEEDVKAGPLPLVPYILIKIGVSVNDLKRICYNPFGNLVY